MTAAGPAAHQHKSVLMPILLTCLGYGCYNLSDAGLKFILQKVYFAQIMVTSGAITIFFMLLYGVLREGKKTFRTRKPGLMFVRALLGQAVYLCNIFAFPHIHLTTFYTLVFTSPFWVAVIASVFFKDKMDRHRMGATLFGFCVILFIFRPGGSLFNGWALLVLGGAFVYSWQLLVIRHIGSGESRAFMYICGSLISVMMGLPLIGNHYVPLTFDEWALLLGMGLVGAIGLLCVSYAFQEAPSASVVAPYHYTQIVWGALLGYYVFHEVPGLLTMGGAGLLIAGGIYLIRHEKRLAMRRPMLG
ncbi:MAG: DMT family transporter [Alphaproteobacteria bacterium]|nr:DMT family transporter [Alphaproteobacteria bacterium]